MGLLIVLLQLTQDASGSDALEKILEQLDHAKTISCELRQESDCPIRIIDHKTGKESSTFLEHSTSKGVVLIKGNKCSLIVNETTSSGSHESQLISDGDTLLRIDRSAAFLKPAKNLRKNIVSMISWFGFGENADLLIGKGEHRPDDLYTRFALGNVRLVVGGSNQRIEYDVTDSRPPRAVRFKVKVSFDPKTYFISTRTLSQEGGWTVTESFDKWDIDSDIPDQKFFVPRERFY
jgi:hypothetical protein